MRRVLLVVSILAWLPLAAAADSITPPPNLCPEYNICGVPTTIEVELGGVGTDTWTDVIELHIVNQPHWFWFADGTSLPPGSIWIAFLWPDGQIGLSTPLTWRADPVPANTLADPAPLATPTGVPEPSTLAATLLGLGAILLLRSRM